MNRRHNSALPTRFLFEGDEILNDIKVAYILSNLPQESEPYDLSGNSDIKESYSGATLAS